MKNNLQRSIDRIKNLRVHLDNLEVEVLESLQIIHDELKNLQREINSLKSNEKQ